MEKISKVKAGKLTFYFGIEQGTQEWLELRKGRVTCSNALTLLQRGKNFCLEANDLAARRTSPNGNTYAERGHVIEYETREELNAFLQPLGLKLVTCTFITNDDYPNAGYSPDGLIVPLNVVDWWNYDGAFIPAEFKAYNDVTIRQDSEGNKIKVRTDKHLKATKDKGEIPTVAQAQCQMEMLIMEANQVCLVLSNPDAVKGEDRVKMWWIDRDEKICSRLIQKLS